MSLSECRVRCQRDTGRIRAIWSVIVAELRHIAQGRAGLPILRINSERLDVSPLCWETW